tara:strand:+ start:505 stop:858 length:354 start_codon:yes stop_codon:yes gene_type:complete
MSKPYDLEERTFLFAKEIRKLISELKKTINVIEDGKQLIRSSGSVAANYIEANEHLSNKDFAYRLKICKKEAKESILWLRLLKTEKNLNNHKKIDQLIQECTELKLIFSSIIHKRQS